MPKVVADVNKWAGEDDEDDVKVSVPCDKPALFVRPEEKVKTCHLYKFADSSPLYIPQDNWEDEEDEKKDEEKVEAAPVAKVKPKSKLQEKIAEKEVRQRDDHCAR